MKNSSTDGVKLYSGRYKSSMGFERKKQRLVMLQGFIEVAAVAAASFFIARAAWIGRITIGDFYLYTANFSTLCAAFSEISDAIKDLLSLSGTYNRFESFTESTSHGERKGEELSLPEKRGIRLRPCLASRMKMSLCSRIFRLT